MKSLTVDHVRALYKARYWEVVKAGDLPAGLDLCVFDFAVNAGPGRGARYLQRLVGATEDGQIGPRTLSLVEQFVRGLDAKTAVSRYQDARRGYYRKLNTFGTFGKGWLRRVDAVEATALKMAT